MGTGCYCIIIMVDFCLCLDIDVQTGKDKSKKIRVIFKSIKAVSKKGWEVQLQNYLEMGLGKMLS